MKEKKDIFNLFNDSFDDQEEKENYFDTFAKENTEYRTKVIVDWIETYLMIGSKTGAAGYSPTGYNKDHWRERIPNYKINDDLTIDIDMLHTPDGKEKLQLSSGEDTLMATYYASSDKPNWMNDESNIGFPGGKLPDYIRFNKIIGNFDVFSGKHIKSLEGSPKYVKGNYSINDAEIKDFTGAPEKITGDFIWRCRKPKYLQSFEGFPKFVGGVLTLPSINDLYSVGLLNKNIKLPFKIKKVKKEGCLNIENTFMDYGYADCDFTSNREKSFLDVNDKNVYDDYVFPGWRIINDIIDGSLDKDRNVFLVPILYGNTNFTGSGTLFPNGIPKYIKRMDKKGREDTTSVAWRCFCEHILDWNSLCDYDNDTETNDPKAAQFYWYVNNVYFNAHGLEGKNADWLQDWYILSQDVNYRRRYKTFCGNNKWYDYVSKCNDTIWPTRAVFNQKQLESIINNIAVKQDQSGK